MRPPTLQYLYLQKPLSLLLLISVISVLCWIGMGEFYTKGEPREASVAVSMIDDNNWILPRVYADEFAYKPPLTHWLMAVFSLPKGEVTPFTARLPSALAFIAMIGICFVFFGQHVKFQEAFVACLIMITSFELHRAAMTARVDMLLTFFIVWGLISLFYWEDRKQLKRFPFHIPLILGCATLVKGPVGIILPLFIFGVYLLILKYNIGKIIYKLTLILLASLILPILWYLPAYKEGGEMFMDLVWAENMGRFLDIEKLDIRYSLGHERPLWFNLIFLLSGFIPWTLLLFFSLFGLKYALKFPGLKNCWEQIRSLPKIKLFSLIALILIILFYSIPASKRSVYLMPAYPFIALFLSQYILYLTEYKVKTVRFFSGFVIFIGIIVGIVCVFSVVTHLIDPVQLISTFTQGKVLSDIQVIWSSFDTPKLLYMGLTLVLLFSLAVSIYQINRKNNLKILYATIGALLAIYLVSDGIFLPAYKNGISIKPFAEKIKSTLPETEHIYVFNNLLEYRNMYGLNFYLGNKFLDFEKTTPDRGLLLMGPNDYEKMLLVYGKDYSFESVYSTPNQTRDGEKEIVLYSFTKKH